MLLRIGHGACIMGSRRVARRGDNSMARGVSNVLGRMVALPLTIQQCQPTLARWRPRFFFADAIISPPWAVADRGAIFSCNPRT